ncbi:hypothetical protein P43SY_005881 [Pythium insidiosum]|uniref:Uncharacterized protein n=1 Tax=Pythium insidiosum TaxID=114742 RepID=A0AAD5LC55_PYTIN|nr:hypothetical protein P43SY_005881 [Pythium insidiosum]KAJ0398663.1 hypothetical protein ATCC90586_007117 [Pythium insidiosum]
MGIQAAPLSLSVRVTTPEHHVHHKTLKKCMRQLHDAIAHPLPGDAQKLKVKILETHPIKTSRFSLSHMKRLAIPPVEVPKSMCGTQVFSAIVGGKKVPFSRDMWCNRKRRANKMRLDSIYENLIFT